MRMVAPRTGAPETTVAEEQEEYLPITVAVYGKEAGSSILLARFRLSDDEREAIANGEDIYVAQMTRGPMTPIKVQVGSEGWLR